MKKQILLFIVVLLGTVNVFAQDVYSCRNANLSFFSSAPMEDIEAKTDKGVSAINTKTGAVYFKVPVSSFQFKKKLMQEHFNENYLETDQYPFAEFKGKYTGNVDCTKNGTYDVMVEGNMTIHGVQKPYKEKGTITVNNGQLTTNSKFNVKLEDHKIKIPTLVIKNIAEVVEVTVVATYAVAPAQAAK